MVKKAYYYSLSNYIKNAARTRVSNKISNVKDFYKIISIYTINYNTLESLDFLWIVWEAVHACALQSQYNNIPILPRW